MQRLAGKNVLVTGASTGFGRGIALACAAEGAHVALVARSRDRLEEVAQAVRDLGVRAVVCPADVGDSAQIQAAVDAAVGALGPIHVLVNNAGTNVAQRSIGDTELAQWRELLEVNLTSAFHFTKLLLPGMMAREEGTIINVASRAATFPSLMAGVGYSTSKIGMQALTDVTNEEGNPRNVRACVINPGEGNTPILDRRAAPPPAEARLGMLQPEDLGEAVVFVASLPPRANVWRLDMKPTQKRVGQP
jgi:NADP-dependent 3-hydroxy acid dehydrogenase YdfG